MGSKKGLVERLVYHGMIYLSRGRLTPKLVSGMGLTLEPMVGEVQITIYAKSRPFSLLSAIFTKRYEEKSSLLMNVTFLYTH